MSVPPLGDADTAPPVRDPASRPVVPLATALPAAPDRATDPVQTLALEQANLVGSSNVAIPALVQQTNDEEVARATAMDTARTADAVRPAPLDGAAATLAGHDGGEDAADGDEESTFLEDNLPHLLGAVPTPATSDQPPAARSRWLKGRFAHASPVSTNGKGGGPAASAPTTKAPSAPIPSLFWIVTRFATPADKVLMICGIIAAIGSGVTRPVMSLVFGQLSNTLGALQLGSVEKGPYLHELRSACLKLVYLGIAQLVSTWLYIGLFLYTSEATSHRLREAYLRAVLRQDIAWFDTTGGGSTAVKIITDCRLVQDGTGEKVSLFALNVSAFVAALIVAFTQSWKLTLSVIYIVPLLYAVIAIGGRFAGRAGRLNLRSYGRAGDIAEEAFSSIRVVSSFMGAEKLARLYDKQLAVAERWGIRKQLVLAIMLSVMFFVVQSLYAFAFHLGGGWVADGSINGGNIISVLWAVVIGSFSLANSSSELIAFGLARAAAAGLYETIDRKPVIDASDPSGFRPDAVEGRIALRGVSFAYPSRPDVVVLHDMSLDIAPGTTCALVGASGSGKSTIVALLERFYNPTAGVVTLDGIPIQDLNIQWLRRQIGYVTQEPVLFKGTLARNVLFGLIGTPMWDWPPERQMPLIVEACKTANAHTFITQLPHGYDTLVGEAGLMLSGGQRQRIAIARAIIRDPKILLLDEATSALDTISERVVSAALSTASQGRTTISIAHRLSTIRHADQIVVMDQGRMVEKGEHESLIAANGFYARLVRAQELSAQSAAQQAGRAAAHSAQEAFEEGKVAAEDVTEADKLIVMSSDKAQAPRYPAADGDDPSLSQYTSLAPPVSVLPAKQGGLKSLLLSRGPQHVQQKKEQAEREAAQREAKRHADPAHPWVTRNGYTLFGKIVGLNRPELHLVVPGVVGSFVSGCSMPSMGIVYAFAIGTIFLPRSTEAERNFLTDRADFFALWLFIIAIVSFIANFLKSYMFGLAGERMTRRMRDQSFRAMLRQSPAFFDEDQNSTGVLCSNLSSDAQNVVVLSGSLMGSIIEFVTNIAVGCAVGIGFYWRIGLINTALLPLSIYANKLRSDIINKGSSATKVYYESSAQVACEAVSALRTVAVLTREENVAEQYAQDLQLPLLIGTDAAVKGAFFYAISQAFSFWTFALTFWLGGNWLYPRADGTTVGGLTLTKLFVVFMSNVYATLAAGRALTLVPDLSKAVDSTRSILTHLRRVPVIDAWSDAGVRVAPHAVKGHVRFENVHFEYPSRPGVPVLRGITLDAAPGQFIALVGASGCGKSTTIQLAERFYDPTQGRITIDGTDLRDMHLHDLRSFVSLVSQEPSLYNMSIRDNITLGFPPNQTPSTEQIERAAKDANIHDFIASLPQGYDTPLANKGLGLSGGQKQRIAIARALIRQPRVLLLDEATSALSSQDEARISRILAEAAKGRTTLSIAHRLSSIQHADRIYVFHLGEIKEQGTHAELIALGGEYYQLAIQQSLA